MIEGLQPPLLKAKENLSFPSQELFQDFSVLCFFAALALDSTKKGLKDKFIHVTKSGRRDKNRGILELQFGDNEAHVRYLVDPGALRLSAQDRKGIVVPFFGFRTISSATQNFSLANKLGQGGFGPVYKGKLPGGTEIAVKRLSSRSGQGLKEFKNEVVLIAKLQHRNLVRLLGYSMKDHEMILLYEYMPNKSLDRFIFDRTLCMCLDWAMRFDIIMGIARGLLYLHQDSRLRIIHRYLKTSNVLLDEEMTPKISDFGLAKIVEGRETEASTGRVIGTYGYMSPEYALNGLFSVKSDVFSFGVVVLEIISGRRNTGYYQNQQAFSLVSYAWGLWKDKTPIDLLDQALAESCNSSE
ncbi:Concanavalin A-like lectin/glucanase, subgroup, partial [Cynara cardunculus var. scolymus]